MVNIKDERLQLMTKQKKMLKEIRQIQLKLAVLRRMCRHKDIEYLGKVESPEDNNKMVVEVHCKECASSWLQHIDSESAGVN